MPNGLYKNGTWRKNVRVYNEPCDEEDGAITPHAVKEMIGSSGEVLVTQAQYDALTPDPEKKYVIYETILDMARLVKGYYKNNEWYEYGSKLYTTMGQNVNGTLTQKAFTEAVASIIDDILGINNN